MVCTMSNKQQAVIKKQGKVVKGTCSSLGVIQMVPLGLLTLASFLAWFVVLREAAISRFPGVDTTGVDDTTVVLHVKQSNNGPSSTASTSFLPSPRMNDSTPSLASSSSSPCSTSFRNLYCSRSRDPIVVSMMAMPHTMSSSTDRLFKATEHAWTTTASRQQEQDRGFSCPHHNQHLSVSLSCHNGTNGDSSLTMTHDEELLACVLERLKYKSKTHQNFNQMRARTAVIFTTLRDPAQQVLSHYLMRQTWDRQWEYEYSNGGPSDVMNVSGVEEWAEKAWWRHNLFTKMLATDSRTIWAKVKGPAFPTREESDRENAAGEDSQWLQLALDRLKTMPFFGLMHRASETFELMGFYLCRPVQGEEYVRAEKQPRPVDPALAAVIEKHFVLDRLLLQAAEPLFDELVKDMRRKKAAGVLCDLSNALHETTSPIGLVCK